MDKSSYSLFDKFCFGAVSPPLLVQHENCRDWHVHPKFFTHAWDFGAPKASPIHQYFHMASHMGVDDAEACKAHAILSRSGIAASGLHLFWPVRQWPCARRIALTGLFGPSASGLVGSSCSSGGRNDEKIEHTPRDVTNLRTRYGMGLDVKCPPQHHIDLTFQVPYIYRQNESISDKTNEIECFQSNASKQCSEQTTRCQYEEISRINFKWLNYHYPHFVIIIIIIITISHQSTKFPEFASNLLPSANFSSHQNLQFFGLLRRQTSDAMDGDTQM